MNNTLQPRVTRTKCSDRERKYARLAMKKHFWVTIASPNQMRLILEFCVVGIENRTKEASWRMRKRVLRAGNQDIWSALFVDTVNFIFSALQLNPATYLSSSIHRTCAGQTTALWRIVSICQ